MLLKDLLTQLKLPCHSIHVQDLRADRYNKLLLITTFGTPVSDPKLLHRLRINLSKLFMKNTPQETISDIYAAKYVVTETYALEKALDEGFSGGAA